MYELSSPGWFKTLNGLPVTKHALPDSIMSHGTSWALGHPISFGFHYTAGCGVDLYDVETARGYPIIALSVDQAGHWHQYSDLRGPVPWHAYDPSRYALGIEFSALPGTCDLNDTQLEAGAKGFAALIEWVQRTYGVAIPVKHVGSIERDYKAATGIWGHVDIKPGSPENPTSHIDTLYHWTWKQYLGRISHWLGTSPHPAHPYPGHVLKLGSDEADVLVLKKRMVVLGYKSIVITPHFGGGLESAVKKFQRKKGLGIDGVVGPNTWGAIWKP